MRLSAIHVLATSLAGACGQAFIPCVEATPSGNAVFGFNYVNACNKWAWIGKNVGVDVSIQADCSLRQNWPNYQAVSYVCIQRSPDPSAEGAVPNKCYWAPDSSTIYGACQLPESHCPNIVNVEGWPRMSPSGAGRSI
ncbi:hypothetical protein CH63R_06094 [Colletotrichum higginsianum IMI 349063]|uniref:Uncharacterized protein n=2 Tax=Colletotrichum higginsianum TaxID=80884 RepID=A0A1B7YEE1_COLHI|nr:hypothetical protein CH63R_06094 [Colletotrichum higginsianum IMI 349063]OBR10402.1 hypothetical protein CH63R_06094 [Colletotrichum higginsianum IMI 349063]